MSHRDIRTDEIAEFLERKGAPELLISIGTSGGRWTDLEEQLDISSATLSDRLEEARKLDLVQPGNRETDTSVSTIYELDTLGKALYHQMHQLNLVRTWTYLKDAREDFDSQTDELVEWVDSGRLREVQEAREQQKEADTRPGAPKNHDEDS